MLTAYSGLSAFWIHIMLKPFKPMLAANPLKDLKTLVQMTDALRRLPYPLLISPKIDGFRAIRPHGTALITRQLKSIVNKHCLSIYSSPKLLGLDGELVVGDPKNPNAMQASSSGLTRAAGRPNVTFLVFDYMLEPGLTFKERYAKAAKIVKESQKDPLIGKIEMVPHTLVHNVEELLELEIKYLEMGYEGVCGRTPDGLYKFGRATLIAPWLFKVKRFVDFEATVTGFVEQMHNGNAATINNLGRSQRSSHKANKSGKDTFGAFMLRTDEGVDFQCGTGKNGSLDDEARRLIWLQIKKDPSVLLGARAKIESFPIGVKEKPRHSKFIGFRSLTGLKGVVHDLS